jgi:catalase
MAKSSKAAANSATIHDQKLVRGNGGELHQIAAGDVPVLTTAQGGPVADDQNTLKVGERGPIATQSKRNALRSVCLG